MKLPKKSLVLAAAVALVAVAALALALRYRPAVVPYLVAAVVVVGLLWIAIELWMRARKRRRQRKFDEDLAAKEGIEDRRREWAQWTAELERHDIDRYELPFYLLVGEPQSGKSILLQNSDLHFPFGQTRLSGVGGTRGCDWWFTEEAVVLDLAGRLFTHEGGASDEAEWRAFLDLLVDFRPMCPANGILLVIPCDGLLVDQREAAQLKANRIQAALVTLSERLQAKLPVYVVLTKADKIFGFAECVHRLEQSQRQQMFGWSRAASRFDAPFDLEETKTGFGGIVRRARLLRSEMMATAKLPEAIGEVHRLSAFPDELQGLWPNLESYLRTVFTDSQLVERLYFRGVYLTSGLQSGVPIAKVCASLIGGHREADARALEALFVQQRAYFIRDLVRRRVFGERALVRPTSARVRRARRTARVGYGAAALVALLAIAGSIRVAAAEETTAKEDAEALAAARNAVERAQRSPSAELPRLRDILADLDRIGRARKSAPPTLVQDMVALRDSSLAELESAIVRAQLAPIARRRAAVALAERLEGSDEGFTAFENEARSAAALLGELHLAAASTRSLVVDLVEPSSYDSRARLDAVLASAGSLPAPADRPPELVRLAETVADMWDTTLEPGCPWQPESGHLGYALAWKCVEEAYKSLDAFSESNAENVHAVTAGFARSLALMQGIELPEGRLDPDKLDDELRILAEKRREFVQSHTARDVEAWPQHERFREFVEPLRRGPAQARKIPPPDVARLVGDQNLRKVCDPGFLKRPPWSWERLESDLGVARELGARDRKVFEAKLAVVAREVESRIKDWSDLSDPDSFVDSPPRQELEPFDVDLVARVASLSKALRSLSQGAVQGTAIRRRLDEQLARRLERIDRLSTETSDERLRALFSSLRSAGELGGAVEQAANAAADDCLDEIQSRQIERWRAAGDDLEDVADVFSGFLSFRQRLASMFGPGLDANDRHKRWLGDVEQLFAELLDAPLQALDRELVPATVDEGTPLPEVARTLGQGLEAAGIRLPDTSPPPIQVRPDELPEPMAAGRRLLERFESLRELNRPERIARMATVEEVRKQLRRFETPETASAAPSELIAKIAESQDAIAQVKDKPSGGVTYARRSWDHFRAHALASLRQRCAARLREDLVVSHRALVEALTVRAPSELARFDNGTLLGQAGAVFDKDQVLDRILREFRLDTEPPFDLALGDEKDEDRAALLRLGASLRELQLFLRGKAEKIEQVELTVTVEPQIHCDDCLWTGKVSGCTFGFIDSYANSFEGSKVFYKDQHQSFPWALSRHTRLSFSWNDLRRPQPMPGEASNPAETFLAPLAVAWAGRRAGDAFEVDLAGGLSREGKVLSAPARIRIQNPSQPLPLPDRPPAVTLE